MAGPSGKPDPSVQPKLRLDKWLVHARFFKTREGANDLIGSGHLRINAQPCTKPGHGIGVGDVLTFPLGPCIRLIRVAALSDRRGPAQAARSLYVDLDPPIASGPLD